MKKSLLTLVVSLFCFSNSYAKSSLGYEYGQMTYTPAGGSLYSFGLHRFSAFDTSGGLTAGIRGGLNKNAAQTVAESKAKETMGSASFATYQYSWNQPAPVPNDGELWSLLLGSEGNPFIDPISPSTTDGNNIHSVLGVEYTSMIWKKEMAPVSLSFTWGFKGYLHTAGKTSEMTFSVPVELTASSLVYENTVVYGAMAVGPYGYLASKAKYNHIELGVNYGFAENWLASLSYRAQHDEYEKSKVIYKMDSKLLALGVKYEF